MLALTEDQARLLAANWPAAASAIVRLDGAMAFAPSAATSLPPPPIRHHAAARLRFACRALAGPPLGDLIALVAAPLATRLGIATTTCRCSARRASLNRHTPRLEAALWLLAIALILLALLRPR